MSQGRISRALVFHRSLARRGDLGILDILGLLFAGILILLFIGVLMPGSRLTGTREEATKQKCANNLKGIAIAMILYSNDYRFFPHMNSHEVENSASDVSTIYRTLYYFKYHDNIDSLICPDSEDLPLPLSQSMIDDPKTFSWDKSKIPAPGVKPIFDKSIDPALVKNEHLSYTAPRAVIVAASARSDTMLSIDKACKPLTLPAIPAGAPAGNHEDGANILYADGHVSFCPIGTPSQLAVAIERLQLEGCSEVMAAEIAPLLKAAAEESPAKGE